MILGTLLAGATSRAGRPAFSSPLRAGNARSILNEARPPRASFRYPDDGPRSSERYRRAPTAAATILLTPDPTGTAATTGSVEGRIVSVVTERLVNLALLLAAAREPVTAEHIRAEGIYPPGQDDDAFQRMFERDKEELRAMGFTIVADAAGRYQLDPRATFAAPLELTDQDAALIMTVGETLAADPSFPYADDLRLALAKVAAAVGRRAVPLGSGRLADEEPERQAEAVSQLAAAATARKRVRFEYTDSHGRRSARTAEPYGLYLRDGRWYLVARDLDRAALRTYAVSRIEALEVSRARPKTPDFERPSDFDVTAYVRLPFQIGPREEEFIAVIHCDRRTAWRLPALSTGRGELVSGDDGSVIWRVSCRSREHLARFLLENGPGLTLLEPDDLVAEIDASLALMEDADA